MLRETQAEEIQCFVPVRVAERGKGGITGWRGSEELSRGSKSMQNKRGGPGRGQGRKPVADTPTKRYTVTLDDKTVEDARDIGDGNLSEGIRRAVKKIKKTTGHPTPPDTD